MMFLFLILTTSCFNVNNAQPAWFSECVGFGCDATLNYNHAPCVVSQLSEAAVKACVEASGNRHVTFTVSGTITLTAELRPSGGLILDGSGQQITFTGEPIRVQSNSIFYRLTFDTGRDDALKLRDTYQDVWVHKCTFTAYGDGLVDITNGFKKVTVSWCEMFLHHKTMLYGASVTDTDTDEITVHHNNLHDLHSRIPRVRYAFVHIFNNVYKDWDYYGAGASQMGRLLVENNWFESNRNANRNIVHVVGEDPEEGFVRQSGNYLGPGCNDLENNPSGVPNAPYAYTLDTANQDMYNAVVSLAGNR